MLDAASSPDHMQALRALYAVSARRNLPAKQVVIREGDPPTTLYLISSGSVTATLTDWHGQEALVAMFGPGEFFGEMGMLPGSPMGRNAQVMTRTKAVILEIPYPAFIALSRDHPSLWLELAGQLASRLRRANRRVAAMRVMKLHDRIAYVLNELATMPDTETLPDGRCIRVTRDELGMLTGCTRETVGRAIAEMEAEGRLRLAGRGIVLPNASAGVT